MCLKVQPPWPMPTETERIGQKLLAENDVYRLIGDRLFAQMKEADYADLYSAEGKPGISPIVLAFVTVFQYMEKLADRQAIRALRIRLDWKYALHLPLEYEGFDYSVLSEFRDRLIKGRAEGRVFEQLVKQIQALGLIKERGKQRSDSMAILTKVRRLGRLETVVETLRLAIVAIVEQDPAWGQATLPPSWEEMYGERFVRERYSEKEWQAYEAVIGENGRWLIERIDKGSAPAEIQGLPEVQVLKTVWTQQFRTEAGKMVYTDLKQYDGHTHIESPHDPEARYSRKRHFEWVGDKVQVTETEDAGYPHIITDMVTTSSNRTDFEELPAIQARLAQRKCKPAEHYTDAGYLSGPNLDSSHKQQIDLIGPLPKVSTPQSRLVEGITHEQFLIDAQNHTVTCPQGVVARHPHPVKNSFSFRFPKATCALCPLRARCCTGKGGRTVGVSAYYELTEAAYARQATEAFKQDYRLHRSGIEGTLSALVRGQGLRVARYIGSKKRKLQAIFSGCAANLHLTARWLAGVRLQVRHKKSWSLNLTQSGPLTH